MTASGLTSLTHGNISVDGSTSSVSFPALADIDDSAIFASNGGHVSLPAVTSMTCSSTSKPCFQNTFQAQGAGAAITLAALTTFTNTTGTEVDAYAVTGGSVKLPALTTINGSVSSNVRFFANVGSAEIDLNALTTLPGFVTIQMSDGKVLVPALTTVAGPVTVTNASVSYAGVTTFANVTVNGGGSLTLGGSSTAPGAQLSISGGGSLTASGLTSLTHGTISVDGSTSSVSFPALADIDDSALFATTGGHVSLPAVTSMTCSSTGKPCFQTMLQAGGTGSVITLAALTTFTNTTTTELDVYAVTGGSVKLPALTTINGSVSSTVRFFANVGSAEIDLNALTTLPSFATIQVNDGKVLAPALTTLTGPLTVTNASVSYASVTAFGNVTVNGGGALTLGGSSTSPGAQLSISGGGSLTASGLTSLTHGTVSVDGSTSSVSFPALANIDDSAILATTGGHVSLPAVTSMTCSSTGKPCFQTMLQAGGTGSVITLAALTTFTNTTTTELDVSAVTGGLVKLAALTTINTPSTATVKFNATGTGSEIDLNALVSGGYDAGKVFFNASGGGTIVRPGGLTIETAALDARSLSLPISIAEVDLDGDGKPDEIAIEPGSSVLDVRVTAGPAGTGATASYALGQRAIGLAIGDWDQDGALDVAVATQGPAGGVVVMLGIGDGTFVAGERVSLPFAPASIAAADADGDGVRDLVFRSADGSQSATLLGHAGGTFTLTGP